MTMKRSHKSWVAGLFVFSFLPLAFGFCCCLNDTLASFFSTSKNNKSSHEDHCSGHKQSDSTQKQCEHDQLAAKTANEILIITTSLPSIVSFTSHHADDFVSQTKINLKTNFFDTGPPGSHFSTTPIYLRISSLRI